MSETLPTVEEVRAIITTALTDAQVASVIGDAALLVERCVAAIEDEDRARTIIKYVTADLIASTVSTTGGGVLQSQALGDASESYAASGPGAEFGKSAYWQRALQLDPNGCLRRLGQKTASLERV